ncbi:MAG: class I SAM-dependent methyltransferase [Candidatus Baltobacteraceae bacterium]
MPPSARADQQRLRELLSGAVTEDAVAAWQGYIGAFHDAVEPSPIAEVFRAGDGRTSYDMILEDLARAVPAADAILDIGCGDGFLAGRMTQIFPRAHVSAIDVSQRLLMMARRKNPRARIAFLQATATSMPFPDESFDAVTAHLVFMLVQPLERALQETRRVLRQNGRCIFVVDRSHEAGGNYGAIRTICLQFLRECWPRSAEPQLGDPRAKSRHEFMDLMAAAGVGKGLTTHDFEIAAAVEMRDVWPIFLRMYVFGSLDQMREAELQRRVLAYLQGRTGPDGRVTLCIPMRIIAGGR